MYSATQNVNDAEVTTRKASGAVDFESFKDTTLSGVNFPISGTAICMNFKMNEP